MTNTRVPAAASKLLTKVPTDKKKPAEYKQFLPFYPYKLVSLLAWGYSNSIERLPGLNYIVHLPTWSTQLGTTSQRLRDALFDAHSMGLIADLKLRRAYAQVRLNPIISDDEGVDNA